MAPNVSVAAIQLTCSPTITFYPETEPKVTVICSPMIEPKVAKVQKEIIIPIQMCLSKSDNIQIDRYIQMSQDLNPSACSCLFIFIYSPYENHTQCNAI